MKKTITIYIVLAILFIWLFVISTNDNDKKFSAEIQEKCPICMDCSNTSITAERLIREVPTIDLSNYNKGYLIKLPDSMTNNDYILEI